MKIEKLQIKDFQGLSGKRTYTFPEKITALAMKNGSGKTSLINAIRYGVAGDYPKANAITVGAEKADVGITMSDGVQVIRELPQKGSAKYWYMRKAIKKEELEKAMTARTGVTPAATHLTTASELVGVMKPQDLSDFMLSYIPETLDTATLIGYVGRVTDGMQSIMEEGFPKTSFGVDELDRFYAAVYDRRRETSRKKSEAEAAIRTFGRQARPEESKEELEKAAAALKELMKARDLYQTKLSAYQKAEAQMKSTNALIAKLTAEIASIKAEAVKPEEKERLQKEIEKKQVELDQQKRVAITLKNSIQALQKAINNLKKPICPLSDKLTCTTDKTVVADELEASLKESEDTLAQQTASITKLVEDLSAMNQSLRDMDAAQTAYTRKQALQEQLKQAESMKTELPEKPEEPEKKDLDNEWNAIQKKLKLHEDANRAEAYKKDLAALTAEYEDLNSLVNAFAAKGRVRREITAAYISAFEEACNERAEELKPGMRMKFQSGNGITPLLDVNGTGVYNPFSALSGGEKIFMVFLLLDMFNSMCGLKLMILDELSVLDKDNLGSLLDLLVNHTDNYDQVILATVDHPDIVDELSKRNIYTITAL